MLRRLKEKLLRGPGEPYVAVTLALVAGGLFLLSHTLSANRDRWEASWAAEFVKSAASPVAYGTSLDVGSWLPPDASTAADRFRYLHVLVAPEPGAEREQAICDLVRAVELSAGNEPDGGSREHGIVLLGGEGSAPDCGSHGSPLTVPERRALQTEAFGSLRPAAYALLGPGRNLLYSRRRLPEPERVTVIRRLLRYSPTATERKAVRP